MNRGNRAVQVALIALLCVALLGLAVPCLAASYWYVSPYGKDKNPGTIDNPFRTIVKAISRCQTGDSIFVAAGTYDEGDLSLQYGVSISGGWDRTFQNYAPFQNRTIVDGGGVYYSGMIVYPTATIQGIKFTGFTGGAVNVLEGSLNLYDCEIEGGPRGVESHNCWYRDYDIQRCFFHGQGVASIELCGIPTSGSWIVANNRFEYTVPGVPSFGSVYYGNTAGGCSPYPDIEVINNTLSGAFYGVYQNGPLLSLDVSRNIFYDVDIPVQAGQVTADRNCFEASGTPFGSNPIYPMCGVDPETWHLLAGSACIDSSTCSEGTLLDFERDLRPADDTCDVGADEYQP